MTTRRRFLAITAAAASLPLRGHAEALHTWQGVALGARATIRLAHPDAPVLTERAAAEISRLEDIFSLFRPDSALSRLNRAGALDAPPFELLECLSMASAVHAASGGRFDPTVQPLWAAWAKGSQTGTRPSEAELDQARGLVGWDRVTLDAGRITLAPGMALTLNGIAQGYIADRIAQMLQAEGLDDVLVDTGEFRALGGHPQGGDWPVKLKVGGAVGLRARALATSAPLGTTFDGDGRMGHILDPRSGRPTAPLWREITVTAQSAALADAASTAACLMPARGDIDACLAQLSGVRLEQALRA